MGNLRTDYDVIVVGAGPSGATTAYELAKAGLSVIMLEKEKFPRYKPCGGGLSLKIERILSVNIKDVIESTITGAYFSFQQKDGLYLWSDRPVAYMVMRDKFDSLLVSEAVKAGASFMDGAKVKGITESKNSYEVIVDEDVFHSRFLVGADGVNGVVRRFIRPRELRTMAASIEAEIPVEKDFIDKHNNYVHIDFGSIPYGYAWVFPKNGVLSSGIAGFRGVVKQPKKYFDQFIKAHPAMGEVNNYHYKGYPIPLFRNQQNLTKDGVLLVGDAGNLVDPFFGEGIYYAIRSAQLASNAVIEAWNKGEANLSGYDDLLKSEFYPEFKAAQYISQFVYTFPKTWFDILTDKPELAEKYYNVLRGESSYPLFLKELKGIAGSLMKTALKSGFLQIFS
ncbi:MAG: geranylgeranyl reductase family protein [Nitrospira sp.]|nr:geranylgeranyl reductase family protein [Nitrospira sp.]